MFHYFYRQQFFILFCLCVGVCVSQLSVNINLWGPIYYEYVFLLLFVLGFICKYENPQAFGESSPANILVMCLKIILSLREIIESTVSCKIHKIRKGNPANNLVMRLKNIIFIGDNWIKSLFKISFGVVCVRRSLIEHSLGIPKGSHASSV